MKKIIEETERKICDRDIIIHRLGPFREATLVGATEKGMGSWHIPLNVGMAYFTAVPHLAAQNSRGRLRISRHLNILRMWTSVANWMPWENKRPIMLGDASGLLFWFRRATCIFKLQPYCQGRMDNLQGPNSAGDYLSSWVSPSMEIVSSRYEWLWLGAVPTYLGTYIGTLVAACVFLWGYKTPHRSASNSP